MNWKILLSITIIGLSFVTFLVCINRQSDPDRLFANLIKQMQKGDYENIYEDSSDSLQLNVNKAEFTERMTDAFKKIKQTDDELNFKLDRKEEISIFTLVRRHSDESANTQNFVIERLGNGDNEIMVTVYWDKNGLFPKFDDLSLLPVNEKRQDLRVVGIHYKKLL